MPDWFHYIQSLLVTRLIIRFDFLITFYVQCKNTGKKVCPLAYKAVLNNTQQTKKPATGNFICILVCE